MAPRLEDGGGIHIPVNPDRAQFGHGTCRNGGGREILSLQDALPIAIACTPKYAFFSARTRPRSITLKLKRSFALWAFGCRTAGSTTGAEGAHPLGGPVTGVYSPAQDCFAPLADRAIIAFFAASLRQLTIDQPSALRQSEFTWALS